VLSVHDTRLTTAEPPVLTTVDEAAEDRDDPLSFRGPRPAQLDVHASRSTTSDPRTSAPVGIHRRCRLVGALGIATI
jgi:hypothetical protein